MSTFVEVDGDRSVNGDDDEEEIFPVEEPISLEWTTENLKSNHHPLDGVDTEGFNLRDNLYFMSKRRIWLALTEAIGDNTAYVDMDDKSKMNFCHNFVLDHKHEFRQGDICVSRYGLIRNSFLFRKSLLPSSLVTMLAGGNISTCRPATKPYVFKGERGTMKENQIGSENEEFLRQATERKLTNEGMNVKIIKLYGVIVHPNGKLCCIIDGVGVDTVTNKVLFLWEGKWIQPYKHFRSINGALDTVKGRYTTVFLCKDGEIRLNSYEKNTIYHQIRGMCAITNIKKVKITVGLEGFDKDDESSWNNIEVVDYCDPGGYMEKEEPVIDAIQKEILRLIVVGHVNGLGQPTENHPPIYCGHCKMTVAADQVMTHNHTHTECQEETSPGVKCEARFRNADQKETHMVAVHNFPPPFDCTVFGCKSGPFIHYNAYLRHMRHDHSDVLHICGICHKIISSKGHLERHLVLLHDPTAEKVPRGHWQCPSCRMDMFETQKFPHLRALKNKKCRDTWNETNPDNVVESRALQVGWFCVPNCSEWGTKMLAESTWKRHKKVCTELKKWTKMAQEKDPRAKWNGSLWKCVAPCLKILLRENAISHVDSCSSFRLWLEQNPDQIYEGNIESFLRSDDKEFCF